MFVDEEPHDCGRGPASLAILLVFSDHDWKEAQKEFETAIGLKPGYAPAHIWYGDILMFMGRFELARKAASEIARGLRSTDLDSRRERRPR